MADTNTNSKAALIAELNGLLADHFALFIKTKNFHWHVKGPRFRSLHELFDEQALEIRDQIDVIAERVRKQGGDTLIVGGFGGRNIPRFKDQDSTSLAADGHDRRTARRQPAGRRPSEEDEGARGTSGRQCDRRAARRTGPTWPKSACGSSPRCWREPWPPHSFQSGPFPLPGAARLLCMGQCRASQ